MPNHALKNLYFLNNNIINRSIHIFYLFHHWNTVIAAKEIIETLDELQDPWNVKWSTLAKKVKKKLPYITNNMRLNLNIKFVGEMKEWIKINQRSPSILVQALIFVQLMIFETVLPIFVSRLPISVLHFHTDNNWVIILPSDFFLFFTNPNNLYKKNTARYLKFGLYIHLIWLICNLLSFRFFRKYFRNLSRTYWYKIFDALNENSLFIFSFFITSFHRFLVSLWRLYYGK